MLLFNDSLVYTTENRQIMKLKLNEEKPKEYGKVSFLTVPFHSQTITAIATCLKRHIVVTASKDKTIRVWSYNSFSSLVTLEICATMYDDVAAMALHPSGNYLLASFSNAV
jgi:WD40 repeat protein